MKTNRTLLDLSGEFLEIFDLLSDFDGDVTDEEKEAEIDSLLFELADNEREIKTKMDGYIAVIAEMEARADFRKEEAARLLASAKQNQGNADKLKARLKWAMKNVFRKDSLETNLHTLKLSLAGGKRSLTLNEQTDNSAGDPDHPFLDAIQDRFITMMPPRPAYKIINKDSVRAALEEGCDLSGFAKLAERAEVLKIK